MQPKRKILYAITKSEWGGAQRYVFDLATRLPKDLFDIAVVCGGGGPLVEKLRGSGVRVISVGSLARDVRIFAEFLALIQLTKIFLSERPDIIHLNSSKAGGLGAVAARAASLVTGHRSLIVFTVHGWAFEEDRSIVWRSGTRFFSWLSAVFQDTVIVISNRDCASAKRFIPKQKLHLIRLGIEAPVFLARDQAQSALEKITLRRMQPNTLVIVTIAEMTKTKGLAYLIEAAVILKKDHPAFPFCVILIGDGEDRSELERKIREHGLENTVVLAGRIPDAARYLSGGDIFVLPSVKEGLPYALIEAMYAGLPIVATRVGGVPDLIRDGVSGSIVPARDPGALANGIAELAASEAKRKNWGASAREEAERNYSIDRMIGATISLYGAHP